MELLQEVHEVMAVWPHKWHGETPARLCARSIAKRAEHHFIGCHDLWLLESNVSEVLL